MKKIVSLHPVYACNKDFFTRDFGQFSYTFLKKKGYNAETRSLKSDNETNFEVNGQLWKGFKSKFHLYLALFRYGKNIDILHQYHIYKYSLLGNIIYKLRNRKGKIFIKMDTPLFLENKDARKEILKVNIYILYLFFSIVDYIGFEDNKLLKFYSDTFPKYKHKFIKTVNGTIIEDEFIDNIQKKNYIVLCGRFGSKQKNYELFLKVLEENKLNLQGWNIYLLGSMTNEFSKKLNILKNNNTYVKKYVKSLGFIRDKNVLYDTISKAKIFLHTANREGDPNIQYDAMFCGCVLVSTNVANIQQNYPKKYAYYYETNCLKGLKSQLNKAIKDTQKLNNNHYITIQKHFLNNFTIEKNLEILLKER